MIALVKFTMRNRSEINKVRINREHEPDHQTGSDVDIYKHMQSTSVFIVHKQTTPQGIFWRSFCLAISQHSRISSG